MLLEDLLPKVSCSFSVKEVILTLTSRRDGIKYVLDNVEKTEHLDEQKGEVGFLTIFYKDGVRDTWLLYLSSERPRLAQQARSFKGQKLS
jgi:hypothetical protein